MSRMRIASLGLVVGLTLLGGRSLGVNEQALQQWKDFIHYSRVARLELAAAAGQSLLEMDLEPQALVEVIEQSPYAEDYEADLARMQRMSGEGTADIADVAGQVERMIDEAIIAVIRDPGRIQDQIEKLDQGLRARMNATQRLVAAGQFAVPPMLEVIRGEHPRSDQLRPLVIEALVAIGRPAVIPLSEAIHDVTDVVRQDIARVLARIGYPAALPFLQRLIASNEIDAETRQVLADSFREIARRRGVSTDVSAARLFHLLAEDYYAAKPSLILQPEAEFNLYWRMNDRGALVYLRIPSEIYPDVMAMRNARRALELDPDLAEALSLWVAANFRRENRLPAGKSDPTYGPEMRSPRYYATLAGPDHLKPVLSRALNDRDPNLARDAIDALHATAGAENLVADNVVLAKALNYPDRRVRFEAAFAVARARPTQNFDGRGRVIPVLAEAVRQSQDRTAVVIAPDQSALNAVAADVRSAGAFDVLMGRSITDVGDALQTIAGADLIVVQAPAAQVETIAANRQANYKLQGAPMVVLARPGDVVTLNRRFRDDPTVIVSSSEATRSEVTSAIVQALATMQAGEIDAEQAEQYAVTALELLRDLAVADLFDVVLAEPGLIEALSDNRASVAAGAAEVLALIDSAAAQRSLTEAGLSEDRGTGLRIGFLHALAESARRFGPMLADHHIDDLLDLVDTATGELADAAAQAHGALNLPTAHSVELITRP